MGFCLSTLDLWELEVSTVNPSVASGASSLWQGSPGVPPVSISHDGFLLLVTSLPRPVSVLRCRKRTDIKPRSFLIKLRGFVYFWAGLPV